MCEVDLVGGPEDGKTFFFSHLPPYIYFPYLEENWAHILMDDELKDFIADPPRKHVYRHVINNLYSYVGIQL